MNAGICRIRELQDQYQVISEFTGSAVLEQHCSSTLRGINTLTGINTMTGINTLRGINTLAGINTQVGTSTVLRRNRSQVAAPAA